MRHLAPAKAQPTLPTVWILATGGTIAGAGSSATDLSNYKAGSILGEQLVQAVPQIAQLAHVRVEQIANVNSSDITIAHWLTLAKRINQIIAEDPAVAGFVVTHGTNTLEETAYFLNLTVKTDRPVVLVGSMRPATAISADGPLNLLNAVRTAIAPDARGKGVLIVLNDEINAARDATKTNTLRVETFKAPELGILGYIDEDRVSFYRSTTRRHTTSVRVRRDVARSVAAGRHPLFLRRARHRRHDGGRRRRRQRHRLRGHRQWRPLECRGDRAQGRHRRDAGGHPAGPRPFEPCRERPRAGEP